MSFTWLADTTCKLVFFYVGYILYIFRWISLPINIHLFEIWAPMWIIKHHREEFNLKKNVWVVSLQRTSRRSQTLVVTLPPYPETCAQIYPHKICTLGHMVHRLIETHGYTLDPKSYHPLFDFRCYAKNLLTKKRKIFLQKFSVTPSSVWCQQPAMGCEIILPNLQHLIHTTHLEFS